MVARIGYGSSHKNSFRLDLNSIAIFATLTWFCEGQQPWRQHRICSTVFCTRKPQSILFRLREHCKRVQPGLHLSLEPPLTLPDFKSLHAPRA